MERRQAERVTSQRDAPTGETATAPAGECAVPKPWFPHDMHNAATLRLIHQHRRGSVQ
jgi:hypothetical protein